MKISEVQIDLIKPNNGLIGFASFVIDGDVYISSVAIHSKLNDEGYRLTYPSKGNFTICHPINKRASLEIEAATLNTSTVSLPLHIKLTYGSLSQNYD